MSAVKTHTTRKLRKSQTPWETSLWNTLRDRNIQALKFTRQFKIGKYIVDFCCLNLKLIIEIDGGQHNLDKNIGEDRQRQKFLESLGYKVLRFWNHEIDNNLEGVVDKIIQSSQPHPNPLPNGRGN